MQYLKTGAVRRRISTAGKRCGSEFLTELDRYIDALLDRALMTHNGGKKTLDATILRYITGQLR